MAKTEALHSLEAVEFGRVERIGPMQPPDKEDADKRPNAAPDAFKEGASPDSFSLDTNIRAANSDVPDAERGRPTIGGSRQATRFTPIDFAILVGSCATTIFLARFTHIGWRTNDPLEPRTLIAGMIIRDRAFNLVSGLTLAGVPILIVHRMFGERGHTSFNSGEWAWFIQGVAWLFNEVCTHVGRNLDDKLFFGLLGLYLFIGFVVQCICFGLSLKYVLANIEGDKKREIRFLWTGWCGVTVSLLVVVKSIALDSVLRPL